MVYMPGQSLQAAPQQNQREINVKNIMVKTIFESIRTVTHAQGIFTESRVEDEGFYTVRVQ